MNKSSRRKAKANILETDSDEEEDDSPSIGASCGSSTRKQIQITEMKDEESKAGITLYLFLFVLEPNSLVQTRLVDTVDWMSMKAVVLCRGPHVIKNTEHWFCCYLLLVRK